MLPNMTTACPQCDCLLRRVPPELLRESEEDDYEEYVFVFGEQMHCDECDKSFHVRNGMVAAPWPDEDEPLKPTASADGEAYIVPSGDWRTAVFRLEDFVTANGPHIQLAPEEVLMWFSTDDRLDVETWIAYLDKLKRLRIGDVTLSREQDLLDLRLMPGAPYWRELARRVSKPRKGILSVEGSAIIPLDVDRFLKLLWVTIRRIYQDHDSCPSKQYSLRPPSRFMAEVFQNTRTKFEVTHPSICPLEIRMLRSLLEEEFEKLLREKGLSVGWEYRK